MTEAELPRVELITPQDRLEIMQKVAQECGNLTVEQIGKPGDLFANLIQDTGSLSERQFLIPKHSVAVAITGHTPDIDFSDFWEQVETQDQL